MASPIEQFQIKPIIPAIGFTNSSLFMVGAAALIVGGLMFASRKRADRSGPRRNPSPRSCMNSSPAP